MFEYSQLSGAGNYAFSVSLFSYQMHCRNFHLAASFADCVMNYVCVCHLSNARNLATKWCALTVSDLLLPWAICFAVSDLLLPWVICFCRKRFAFAVSDLLLPYISDFAFAVSDFLLPHAICFCRNCDFAFAVSDLLLLWAICFCREWFAVSEFAFAASEFAFAVSEFPFVVSDFLLPWAISFCRDSCGPS